MDMDEKIIYTPSEVNDLMASGNAVVIDIRDTKDYKEDHIHGAVNIPDVFFYLGMSTPEGLDEMHKTFAGHFSKAGLTPDKIAIIYEDAFDSRYGGSCRGYWLLKYLGHNNVGILDGGLSAWTEDGLPTDAELVKVEPSEFVVKPNKDIMVTKAEMIDIVNTPGSVKLLDNRDKIEWIGKSSSPYGIDFAPRKGRLPGATWIEWYEFMQRDGTVPHFKTDAQVRAMLAEKGIAPDDDVVIYCFKGARASNTYVALKKAGFKKVRNYFGSWNEWSRDPNLPIDDSILK